jgi:hypothetical protein
MPFGVDALSSFNGRLIIGGGFQSVTTYNNETLPVRGIIAWTGSWWAWLNDVTIGVPYFVTHQPPAILVIVNLG